MPSSSERTPTAVIFDLDGTLVDSNRDLVPTLNRTTALDGVPPISLDAVGHVVGQGAMAMIAKAFSFHGHGLNADRHRELFEIFLADYEAHLCDNTVFFDGALAAMEGLKADGWRLLVCTNKLERFAVKLLEGLGASGEFEGIVGGDTFSFRKPDPRHITATAERFGVPPENCVMVGDSINDIQAAKDARMPVIAVTFGYSDVPVETLEPDHTIAHFDELQDAVRSVFV
ncbi:MAG: phosphoglycolate phosphatase [Pseudomonadota bacterium]